MRIGILGSGLVGAAAFSTVPSEVCFDVFAKRERADRPSMICYGDDAEAKRVAATLVSDVGFNPVDAGPRARLPV